MNNITGQQNIYVYTVWFILFNKLIKHNNILCTYFELHTLKQSEILIQVKSVILSQRS